MRQIGWIVLTILLLLLAGANTMAEDMTGKYSMDYGFGSGNQLPGWFIYWLNDDWALVNDISFGIQVSGDVTKRQWSLGTSILRVLAKSDVFRWETMVGVDYNQEIWDSGYSDPYLQEHDKIIYGMGLGFEYYFKPQYSLNCFLEYTSFQDTSLYSDGSITNNFETGPQYKVSLRWYPL